MTDQLSNRLDGAIDAIVAREDATAALRDPELASLVRIAADLRHYPGVNFKARLRAQLERRQTMSTAVPSAFAEAGLNRRLREGFTAVTPYVWVPDRGFSDFLVRVFDAVETRVTEGGRHGTHREMRVGDSMLMLGEGAPGEIVPGRSMAFHVFVDDVDAVYAKALAAGGESLGEPADRPYGERAGFIKDAYGYDWYIASPLGPQSFAHSLRTVTPFLHTRDVRGYIDFLVRAFGASEEVVYELPGGEYPLRPGARRRRGRRTRHRRSDARRPLSVCRGSGPGVRAGRCRGREAALTTRRSAVRRTNGVRRGRARQPVVHHSAWLVGR